jgi:tetratricopeptide (TPR) repeat protein
MRWIAAILLVLAALTAGSPVLATAAASTSAPDSAAVALEAHPEKLANEVDLLSHELKGTEKIISLMLLPITVLVSILAAGGILGVVYSVRDQRRTSQLHELTVGGEIAAQRRSEQSYGSFFEQSQTTLSLVNDTLQLAKEANDRAMKSMQSKAQSRIDEIEERSQTLLLEVFGEEEFELIINDPRRRDELHDIAAELRSLEGYLSLQEIRLPQYTKFIKALDQFLLDDTEAAIDALRLAFQESAVGELRRFIEYWLGYMLTTVGNYEEANSKFRDEETDIDKGDSEYFQLDRIIAETKFFDIAKTNAENETSNPKKRVITTPHERFELVADLLDELGKQAETLEQSTSHRAKHHTRLEIARTRVDIYEWVAYDSDHLDDPLENEAVRKLNEFLKRPPEKEDEGLEPVRAVEFLGSSAWDELQDPEVFRAWVLSQAQSVCQEHENRNLDVEFALAECLFKLGKTKGADNAFESAERALHHEAGEFHEKRRTASIHQSVLICHSRLLKLREKDPNQKEDLSRRVREASQKTIEVVKDMRQGGVTIFSQIQRRNVTQDEFSDEVREIVKQAEK